jgi:hypothetical protein
LRQEIPYSQVIPDTRSVNGHGDRYTSEPKNFESRENSGIM